LAREPSPAEIAVNVRASALASVVMLGACAYGTGYDPARYANGPDEKAVDQEIEPLPPSPKRWMRDPRGTYAIDAGDAATPSAPPERASGPASSPTATCGTKANLCPMQRFMLGTMETAHTSGTLTTAFTLVAGMSPDPEWAWVAIATRGADLANAGDLRAAKGQCTACHDAYRSRYQALHRARPL
jgi:hypothetical protein